MTVESTVRWRPSILIGDPPRTLLYHVSILDREMGTSDSLRGHWWLLAYTCMVQVIGGHLSSLFSLHSHYKHPQPPIFSYLAHWLGRENSEYLRESDLIIRSDSVAEWIWAVDLETVKCRARSYRVQILVTAVVGRFFIRGEIPQFFPSEAVHRN